MSRKIIEAVILDKNIKKLPEKINTQTWSDMIKELSKYGFKVDASYKRGPDGDRAEMYYNGNTYEGEFTKYFDGTWELMRYNVREVLKSVSEAKRVRDYEDETETVLDEIEKGLKKKNISYETYEIKYNESSESTAYLKVSADLYINVYGLGDRHHKNPFVFVFYDEGMEGAAELYTVLDVVSSVVKKHKNWKLSHN